MVGQTAGSQTAVYYKSLGSLHQAVAFHSNRVCLRCKHFNIQVLASCDTEKKKKPARRRQPHADFQFHQMSALVWKNALRLCKTYLGFSSTGHEATFEMEKHILQHFFLRLVKIKTYREQCPKVRGDSDLLANQFQKNQQSWLVLCDFVHSNFSNYEPQLCKSCKGSPLRPTKTRWWMHYTGGTWNHTNYQVMTDRNGKDLTYSVLKRPSGALLCSSTTGITGDKSFPAAKAEQSAVSQIKNTRQEARSEPVSVSLFTQRWSESALALYFSGEQDALSFTVWGGNRLQLEEIQQHLDLYWESLKNEQIKNISIVMSQAPLQKIQTQNGRGQRLKINCVAYLCHHFQGPAVPHADGLCWVSGDLAVLLSGP